MNIFNQEFATGGGAYRAYDGEDDADALDSEDVFGGAVREGYDSYGIYDPSTKKTIGRYISKSPYNAAMKAARRVFYPNGKKPVPKGKKPAAKGKKPTKGGYFEGETDVASTGNPFSSMADNLVSTMNNALNTVPSMATGGAKKKLVSKDDAFRPGGETRSFFLKKTTRGSKRDLYRYSALLRYYRNPLVIRRGNVDVTITYKIFVTREDLPPSMQAMVDAKKEEVKMKVKKVADKEKNAAKKAAEKEKLAAKKAAEKEKKAAKKAAEKEKKAAKKATGEKKAKKAKKATGEKKAKKTTGEKKAKKAKKPTKMSGGACGSCSMFY